MAHFIINGGGENPKVKGIQDLGCQRLNYSNPNCVTNEQIEEKNIQLNQLEQTCAQTLKNISNKLGPVFNNIQCSVAHTSKKTEKLMQKSGKRAHKTMQRIYSSVSNLSQRFKRSTRRRYRLDNTPTNTPTITPSRASSRVTPGKFYSPFDLNTPRTPCSYIRESKRLHNTRTRRNVFGKENDEMWRKG